MEIKGEILCLFEQSGTFKNVFRKLGYKAYDYDILNDFGETDFVMDLFHEIELAYTKERLTFFDALCPDDLIMAFFPCIYFTGQNMMYFCGTSFGYRNYKFLDKIADILERNRLRAYFYEMIVKLVAVAAQRSLRLVIENPYAHGHYLNHNFILAPALIDNNRTLHGDLYIKPTAYYALNCNLGYWKTWMMPTKVMKLQNVARSRVKGHCSKQRSMISVEYATNFVKEIILSSPREDNQLTMFL